MAPSRISSVGQESRSQPGQSLTGNWQLLIIIIILACPNRKRFTLQRSQRSRRGEWSMAGAGAMGHCRWLCCIWFDFQRPHQTIFGWLSISYGSSATCFGQFQSAGGGFGFIERFEAGFLCTDCSGGTMINQVPYNSQRTCCRTHTTMARPVTAVWAASAESEMSRISTTRTMTTRAMDWGPCLPNGKPPILNAASSTSSSEYNQ